MGMDEGRKKKEIQMTNPTKNAKHSSKSNQLEDDMAESYQMMVKAHYDVQGYENALGFIASHIGRLKFKIEELEKEIKRLRSK